MASQPGRSGPTCENSGAKGAPTLAHPTTCMPSGRSSRQTEPLEESSQRVTTDRRWTWRRLEALALRKIEVLHATNDRGIDLRVVDEGLDQILDSIHQVLAFGEEDATAAETVEVRTIERRRRGLVVGPLLDGFDQASAYLEDHQVRCPEVLDRAVEDRTHRRLYRVVLRHDVLDADVLKHLALRVSVHKEVVLEVRDRSKATEPVSCVRQDAALVGRRSWVLRVVGVLGRD